MYIVHRHLIGNEGYHASIMSIRKKEREKEELMKNIKPKPLKKGSQTMLLFLAHTLSYKLSTYIAFVSGD